MREDLELRPKNHPAPAVAAIVKYDGNVILAYSNLKEIWTLPGGYVEPGESLEEALIREVKEETNVDVEIEDFLVSYPLDLGDRRVIYIVFTAMAKIADVKAGGDVSEVDIVSQKKALEKATGPLARRALEKWMNQA